MSGRAATIIVRSLIEQSALCPVLRQVAAGANLILVLWYHPGKSERNSEEHTGHVVPIAEICRSSKTPVDDAIGQMVPTASQTLRNTGWFEVTQIRGHVPPHGTVGHLQVGLKFGFGSGRNALRCVGAINWIALRKPFCPFRGHNILARVRD